MLYVICKLGGHLVAELCTELCAAFFAAAAPVAKPALLEVKVRFVPENRRDVCVADSRNPLVHVRAELRMIWAGGNLWLSVYGDLAHVVIPCCEFRISFTAKHAADAPRIHVNGKSHRGRIVHDLLHGVIIVLQVFFAPSMEDCVVSCFLYVYKVHVCELRRAHTKVADAFNHG